jgi:hypothetical protein
MKTFNATKPEYYALQNAILALLPLIQAGMELNLIHQLRTNTLLVFTTS